MTFSSRTAQAFWKRFLDSQSDPAEANGRFYESFRIGTNDRSADEGARLILSGEKTATSSLLWEYEESGKPLPYVGALSVLEDGKRRPVCVIETTWVEVTPFDKVDAGFAYDYGETDGTLAGWRKMNWTYYVNQCAAMGREMTIRTPLICERFRVIFP